MIFPTPIMKSDLVVEKQDKNFNGIFLLWLNWDRAPAEFSYRTVEFTYVPTLFTLSLFFCLIRH